MKRVIIDDVIDRTPGIMFDHVLWLGPVQETKVLADAVDAATLSEMQRSCIDALVKHGYAPAKEAKAAAH